PADAATNRGADTRLGDGVGGCRVVGEETARWLALGGRPRLACVGASCRTGKFAIAHAASPVALAMASRAYSTQLSALLWPPSIIRGSIISTKPVSACSRSGAAAIRQ